MLLRIEVIKHLHCLQQVTAGQQLVRQTVTSHITSVCDKLL